MKNWEDFIEELDIIEAKYWQHFRASKLCNHYILDEGQNQLLKFAFKKESDLASVIKEECLKLFKKYQSLHRIA
jgi:hypothetical protein